MNDEIFDILQEECAEVIQAVSKVKRFGLMNEYKGTLNRDHLEEEIGDLVAMLDLLYDNGTIRLREVTHYAVAKKEKLRKWSNIEL